MNRNYRNKPMDTIVIQTHSKSTTKLLVELAKKLGENVQILDKEIAEDLALGELMNQSKSGKMVSKQEIITLLNQ